jgi:hypothetical protein
LRPASLHSPDALRHLLTQTFDTILFEYSTFGWFAHLICITYAAGRLPSSIQYYKKLIPDLCIQDTQKVTKKVKASEKRLKFSPLRYNEEANYQL